MSESNFKYMSFYISKVARRLDPKVGDLYVKFWNPINYVIICGTGVLINMSVLLPLSNLFPLWLANLFAIGTAVCWNWANTVGTFGWLWGFKEKKEK